MAVQMVVALAQALNPNLAQYMRQVASLARKMGESMHVEAAQLDQIEMAGLIHDIGLLSLPKELQLKDPKMLTEEQYRNYCEHPVTGSIILESIDSLAEAGEMVLFHHELLNGKGFPNGLSKDQIPLGAKILLAASDYCHIIATWPRSMRQLVGHARRQLGAEEWKRFAFSQDPESIIEASAEILLLKDPEGKYDKAVVKALIEVIHEDKTTRPTSMVQLDDLKGGMILMEDLHLEDGRLLITRGTKLVATTIQTLQGLGTREMISKEIFVSLP